MSGPSHYWRNRAYFYRGHAVRWRRRALFLIGTLVGIIIINIIRLVHS